MKRHLTNEEVFRIAGEKRSYFKTLKKKQDILIGKILRYEGIIARVIKVTPNLQQNIIQNMDSAFYHY